MDFRKARLEEIDEIYNLFLETKLGMEKVGNLTWSNGYPNKKIFLNDIKNNNLYVLVDGNEIVGSMGVDLDALDYFFHKSKDENKLKDMLSPTDCQTAPYVVFERLMVKPSRQGQGLGHKIFDYMFKEFKGYSVLFAVYRSNTHAINMYKRMGIKDYGTYPGWEWGIDPNLCILMCVNNR